LQQRLGLLSKQTAAARLGLDYPIEQQRLATEPANEAPRLAGEGLG